jgi:hypothetical protein
MSGQVCCVRLRVYSEIGTLGNIRPEDGLVEAYLYYSGPGFD